MGPPPEAGAEEAPPDDDDEDEEEGVGFMSATLRRSRARDAWHASCHSSAAAWACASSPLGPEAKACVSSQRACRTAASEPAEERRPRRST